MDLGTVAGAVVVWKSKMLRLPLMLSTKMYVTNEFWRDNLQTSLRKQNSWPRKPVVCHVRVSTMLSVLIHLASWPYAIPSSSRLSEDSKTEAPSLERCGHYTHSLFAVDLDTRHFWYCFYWLSAFVLRGSTKLYDFVWHRNKNMSDGLSCQSLECFQVLIASLVASIPVATPSKANPCNGTEDPAMQSETRRPSPTGPVLSGSHSTFSARWLFLYSKWWNDTGQNLRNHVLFVLPMLCWYGVIWGLPKRWTRRLWDRRVGSLVRVRSGVLQILYSTYIVGLNMNSSCTLLPWFM